MIPILCKLIKENEDAEILQDCTWTLSYIEDANGKKVEMLIQNDMLPRLVQLLEYLSQTIYLGTLQWELRSQP